MGYYSRAIATMAIHPIAAIRGWAEVDTDITTAYASNGKINAYDYARSLHAASLAIKNGRV